MESFFATLKTEFIRGIVYPSCLEIRDKLFEYIKMFYNVAVRLIRT